MLWIQNRLEFISSINPVNVWLFNNSQRDKLNGFIPIYAIWSYCKHQWYTDWCNTNHNHDRKEIWSDPDI